MDDQRFESAWEAHAAAVLRYCTYSLGSQQEAEDVAAETFERFITKGDRVQPEHTEAWLIKVARNLCISRHRSARRRQALESHLAQGAQTRTNGSAPGSWEYVRRLKESERLTLYLRLAEDRSFGEIARLLGKSESAVKMTFYRSVDRLRRDMERDIVAESNLVEGADHA